MKLHYVKFTLKLGNVVQRIMNGVLLCPHEIWALTSNGNERSSVLARFFQKGGSAPAIRAKINTLDVKEPLGSFQHVLAIKSCPAVHNAVRGENHQPAALHRNQRHHHEFIGSNEFCLPSLLAARSAIGKGRLVAMVSVGDEQLLIA